MNTLIYLVIIFVFALIDWFFIEVERIEPNKRIMWGTRALLTSVYAFAAKDFAWVEGALYTFFLAFLFYSLFDYTLNILRGKRFFHKGKNLIDKIIPAGLPDLAFKIIFVLGSYGVYQYKFFNCLRIGFLEPGFFEDVKTCIELML